MSENPTKKRRVVGVDFDDVLHDFFGGLVKFHNKKYGTSHSYEDMRMGMHEVWGCTVEEMTGRMLEFYDDNLHHEVHPVDGAVEAIGKLSQKYSVAVVTSRPDYVKERTLEWLYKHFPKEHFDGIHFTGIFAGRENVRKKSEVCRELGVEIFIDDFIHNAEDVASTGCKVLLLDKPWNREELKHPNIRRVHSWPEILEIIKLELT